MSILDPLSCGFAKAAAYSVLTNSDEKKTSDVNKKQYKSKVLKKQYELYQKYFGDDFQSNFDVDYKHFTDNFTKIITYLREVSKRHSNVKLELLDVFSKNNWSDLNASTKETHTLNDCNGCLKNKQLKNCLAKLPVKSAAAKAKATTAGLYKEQVLADVTNKIVTELNQHYKESYRTSFTTQAKKHVDNFKSKTQSKDKKSKVARSLGLQITKDVNKQYGESSVERYVHWEYSYFWNTLIQLLCV